MNQNKKICIIVILAILINIFTLAGLLYVNRGDKEEIQDQCDQYETYISSLEDKLIIDKEDYKKNVIKFANSARVAQLYMPDYFVYYGIDDIVFEPLNNNYPQNNYYIKDNINNYKEDNDILSYSDENTNTLFGIDISEYQKDIDWDKIKENDDIDFVFIRVGYRGYTKGKIKLDNMFKEHIENANEAGIPVGVYFFSGAINEEEVIEEAEFVLDNIKDYNVELEVVYDMEVISGNNNRMKDLTNEDRTLLTKTFVNKIKENNYTPMVYGNAKWFMDYVNYEDLLEYNLWYANYASFNWPYKVNYFQYSESGKIDGIKGNVDMNIKFINK